MHSNQDGGQNDCYHDNTSHGNDCVLPVGAGLWGVSRMQHLQFNKTNFEHFGFLFDLLPNAVMLWYYHFS